MALSVPLVLFTLMKVYHAISALQEVVIFTFTNLVVILIDDFGWHKSAIPANLPF
jgi:hypothetical protein